MSFTPSQSINLLTTLVRFLQNQIPTLGARGTDTFKLPLLRPTELINQLEVTGVVQPNLIPLAKRIFMAAGVSTLFPTLSVVSVNLLGFMGGGVLRGK